LFASKVCVTPKSVWHSSTKLPDVVPLKVAALGAGEISKVMGVLSSLVHKLDGSTAST